MSHRLVLPQTNAPVCPGLAEPSGGFARGRASTPIRTWSARAIAPPPGPPGAATDADQPHRQRVRQTSLPRHSGCRSTERPFRCVVVDHTVRPSQAVPSREGTPVRHDQHQRPARNPPSVDRPLLPAEPSTYAVSSGVCSASTTLAGRRQPFWPVERIRDEDQRFREARPPGPGRGSGGGDSGSVARSRRCPPCGPCFPLLAWSRCPLLAAGLGRRATPERRVRTYIAVERRPRPDHPFGLEPLGQLAESWSRRSGRTGGLRNRGTMRPGCP